MESDERTGNLWRGEGVAGSGSGGESGREYWGEGVEESDQCLKVWFSPVFGP